MEPSEVAEDEGMYFPIDQQFQLVGEVDMNQEPKIRERARLLAKMLDPRRREWSRGQHQGQKPSAERG